YIDDQIEGIYRLLFSDYVEPINIGNDEEISSLSFAEEIIKLTGTNQKIVHKPLPADDPLQRKPDISRARRILNWQPRVTREEGMKRTFEFFQSLAQEELF